MTDPTRAGIYCRMSLAIMNDPTKVEDQARVSRELAERLHWGIAEGCGYPEPIGVYTDNSRSAWQKNRKRPAWDAMLADVESGKLDAIVVYHGDRLVRQPFDLETLINLADGKGVKLAAPTGMRSLDNSDDRFVLRILVAQACMESDSLSRRRKSQYERWRRDGKVRPGGRGGRAYGFETDGTTHIPRECEIISEVALRLMYGESIGGIARDLAARGERTAAGSPFAHYTLTKTMSRPRYAGLMPDGVSRAAWEPVLDRETWEIVNAVIAARKAQFAYTTNARRYLLSGLAACGACETPLQIRQSRGRAGRPAVIGYGCTACRKTYRSQPLLDAYVTGRTVSRLANPANPVVQAPEPGYAAELAALAERRVETENFIASLADAPAQRIAVLSRALDSFDAKIAAIREQMTGSANGRLLTAHAGVSREDFEALPLEVRRQLVRACYRVIVLPASKRGPGFREQDVQMVPV